MTEAPKLLTEAEWRELWFMTGRDEIIEKLRERGLIAPEPVDPLLVEARSICNASFLVDDESIDLDKPFGDFSYAHIESGKADNHCTVQIALAALRRGMELAPAARPLTREMVTAAVIPNCLVVGGVLSFDIDAIHAALTRETPDA